MATKFHLAAFALAFWTACKPPPADPQPQDALIASGREIFFNETFEGNGRTCGTCHRAENNFTIDPTFISTLPDNDALFVSEFDPALQKNFENAKLLRAFGLITENLDGFENLDSTFNSTFTLRGVPHTLGLRNTVASPTGPHTGWSGDGAPGDATLRSFATGAVIQHFTKTLNRVPGVDFRLPTDEELDALEAFQLSLGRQEELKLPLSLKSVVALRGQALFNVPSLIEAADTGPFFHNNSVETIEGAVAFYDGEAFNNSPAAEFLENLTGGELELDATQIVAIAAFLRVIL